MVDNDCKNLACVLLGSSDRGDSFKRLDPYLEPSVAFTCATTPTFLASDVAHDSNRLVADLDPRNRDCSLVTGLLVAEMSA